MCTSLFGHTPDMENYPTGKSTIWTRARASRGPSASVIRSISRFGRPRRPREDTAWESPWGPGRPGWHIECSAMAESLLGVDFEIHGGGSDLIFPHHENEAAQTRAARDAPLARLWVHNGMVRLDHAKMAKSVGNIFVLHDALASYGRDALIMYFCSGHYRQPIEFDDERLSEAAARVQRIREAGARARPGPSPDWSAPLRERFFDCAGGRLQHSRGACGGVRLGAGGEQFRSASRAIRTSGDARRAGAGKPARRRPSAKCPMRFVELADARERARAAARFRARRSGPGPAPRAWLGGPRRRLTARNCCPLQWSIYGRNPVREALRGPRRVHRIWATTGTLREPWLATGKVPIVSARAEQVESLCGSPSHQGICAEVEPYRYASAEDVLGLAAPLIVALDQVQDPQNLGADLSERRMCRRSGSGDPRAALRGGDGGGLQGLGWGGRAPSRGAGPQPG